MSTSELQNIQSRERSHCATGGPGAGLPAPTLRTYAESTAAVTTRTYFVNPATGDDRNPGTSATSAFRTLTRALGVVPYVAPGTAPAVRDKYVINLAAGADFYGSEEEAASPRPAGVVYRDSILFFDQRAGDRDHPVIIQAEGGDSAYFDELGNLRAPDLRPRIHFRLELRSLQYVYLKNLRIIIVDHRIAGARDGTDDARAVVTGNVSPVHCSTIPSYEAPGALRTEHILLRGCEIDGGWRQMPETEPPRATIEQEVLKVNQCQHFYIERCRIHGAYGSGKNCVDFVAVQYGHVVDSDFHSSAHDWCVYAKGGSAYLRFEGNRIHDGAKGFAAGEGTDSEVMVRPWWHYEAYAIQFVNNLLYGIPGTGIGVQGGYDVLIAHNTLYDVGWNAQIFSIVFGLRRCGRLPPPRETETNVTACRAYINDNLTWATTHPPEPGVPMIPNRHLYIYNNVTLNRRPITLPDFNVFAVADDLADYQTYDPAAEYPDPSRLPRALRADTDLSVVGNFFGVAGYTDVWSEGWFANAPDRPARPGDTMLVSFSRRFRDFNRTDGALPELNTADPSDRANYLRPSGGTSNVFADSAVSKTAPPPAPLPPSTWLGGLPLLPGGVEERPAPWDAMHTVYLDFDKVCRLARPVAGASIRGMTAPPAPTALRIVEVGAPAINRVFSGSDRIVVTDSVAHFTLTDTRGDAFLQSRTLPVGVAGAIAEGLYGYEYRIHMFDLVSTRAGGGRPCVVSLSVEFGDIVPLSYDPATPGRVYDIFVVTRGGMGTVRPSEARQAGRVITFLFAPPVCSGTAPGNGQSTFFFGLSSRTPPRAITARARDDAGNEYTLGARAPR